MNNTEPVLLVLTPGFPANESDSSCLPAQQNFIKALQENHPGIKIIVVSFQYPFTAEEYQWHGITVHAFGGKNRNGLFRRLLWQKIWTLLKSLQQQHHISAVLSFWCDECALLAARFSNKYRVQHYCWLFGQDAKKGNRYVRQVSGGKNNFIALSDFISRSFAAHYNMQPPAIIPLGINPADFSATEHCRDIDLLAAGSLIPLKQFDVFIRVAAKLKQVFPAIRIVLCGDGPGLPQLKLLAIQQGIAANISFAGALPHRSLLQLMQRSKIFLHPSSYEGFGMVCAEALYAGAQVISFCKPVDAPVRNWHIVANEIQMKEKAEGLLHTLPQPEKIMYCSNAETADAMMKLFGL